MERYRTAGWNRHDNGYKLFPVQEEIQQTIRRQLHAGLPGLIYVGQRGGKSTLVADLAARFADEQRAPHVIVVGVTQSQAEMEMHLVAHVLQDARFMRRDPPQLWITGKQGFQRLLANQDKEPKVKIERNTIILITEAPWMMEGEALTFWARTYSDYVVAYGSPSETRWACDPIIPRWATWEVNDGYCGPGSHYLRTRFQADKKAATRDFGCGKDYSLSEVTA